MRKRGDVGILHSSIQNSDAGKSPRIGAIENLLCLVNTSGIEGGFSMYNVFLNVIAKHKSCKINVISAPYMFSVGRNTQRE